MPATETFEDHYEVLQLSPNAEAPIIQCVYTVLSQRYHPGNKETRDDSIYEQLLKAKGTLSNPDRRATYDAKYKANRGSEQPVVANPEPVVAKSEAIVIPETDTIDIQAEQQKRSAVLEILYKRMMRSPVSAAMNTRELETELGLEKASLDVTVWYLKERQLVRTGDNGRLLITADGMDKFEA